MDIINSEKLVKADSDTTDLVTSLYFMRKLQHFASIMPDGQYVDAQYLDGHCNYNRCAAIFIRMDGEVCPILKNPLCCMNPLHDRYKRRDDMTESDEREAHLSSLILSGRCFKPNYSQGTKNWLKLSIDSYNKQVMEEYADTEMVSCLQEYIVAAYEF